MNERPSQMPGFQLLNHYLMQSRQRMARLHGLVGRNMREHDASLEQIHADGVSGSRLSRLELAGFQGQSQIPELAPMHVPGTPATPIATRPSHGTRNTGFALSQKQLWSNMASMVMRSMKRDL